MRENSGRIKEKSASKYDESFSDTIIQFGSNIVIMSLRNDISLYRLL